VDFVAALEARIVRRIGSFAAAGVSLALAGCIDTSDYDTCVAEADGAERYMEVCGIAPSDGICPDADSEAALALAKAEADRGNCGTEGLEVRKVVCGPENDGLRSGPKPET
jgi:hypothetical protein